MNLWEATYDGRACTVREVTDAIGEEVTTNDGNVHARKGDYVALDLAKAPRGYRSRHIEKVLRAKDNRLVLVRQIDTPVEVDQEVDFFDEDD